MFASWYSTLRSTLLPGTLNHIYIMAILSGFTTGSARKSAGDITYTRLNGQNIAKAKIMRNPNYKPSRSQLEQRVTMGLMGKAMRVLLPAINLTCNKSTYGSRLNAYSKQYKGASQVDMFGPTSPISLACSGDVTKFTPNQFLEIAAGTSFDDLKPSVGGSAYGVLSVSGTSSAAIYKLTVADMSQVMVGDQFVVYEYSSAEANFTAHGQARTSIVTIAQEDIDAGFVTAPARVLVGKYQLAIGCIYRGSTVLTSSNWINDVLAS